MRHEEDGDGLKQNLQGGRGGRRKDYRRRATKRRIEEDMNVFLSARVKWLLSVLSDAVHQRTTAT